MKKYFILAVGFVVAMMTSCVEPGQHQPTEGVKITLSQHELTMGVEETTRLSTTITPAGTNVQLKWASTDATVATVSVSGIVTAVAEGTAKIIVSAEGAIGDTCVVTVSDQAIYNEFNIADYGLFGAFEPIAGTDTTIELSIGMVDVQLASITLLAWDGNLLYSSGFSGAGFCIEAPVTFWVITDDHGDGTYNGFYIGAGGFYLHDLKAPRQGNGQAGSVNVNDYAEFLKGYIVAETADDVNWDLLETAFPGAQIIYVSYSDPENPYWGDSYGRYYGHVTECLFLEPETDGEEPSWFCNLEWHEFLDDNYYFGLAVNLDEEGYLASVVEPYDFKTIAREFSYNYSEEEAPRALKLMSPATIHKEVPAFVGHKSTDRFYFTK
jgi:hypothetical protein